MEINEEIIDAIFDKEIDTNTLIDKHCLLFATVDNQFHFLKLNKNWEKILGYNIKELTEEPFTNFLHPKDLEKSIKVYKKGETFNKNAKPLKNFTNRYKTKDGNYAVIDWVSILKTNNNNIIAIAIFRHYE